MSMCHNHRYRRNISCFINRVNDFSLKTKYFVLTSWYSIEIYTKCIKQILDPLLSRKQGKSALNEHVSIYYPHGTVRTAGRYCWRRDCQKGRGISYYRSINHPSTTRDINSTFVTISLSPGIFHEPSLDLYTNLRLKPRHGSVWEFCIFHDVKHSKLVIQPYD